MGNIACLPIDLMILRLVLFKYILKVIGCGFEFEIPRSRNFKLKTSTERTPHPTLPFPPPQPGGVRGRCTASLLCIAIFQNSTLTLTIFTIPTIIRGGGEYL